MSTTCHLSSKLPHKDFKVDGELDSIPIIVTRELIRRDDIWVEKGLKYLTPVHYVDGWNNYFALNLLINSTRDVKDFIKEIDSIIKIEVNFKTVDFLM